MREAEEKRTRRPQVASFSSLPFGRAAGSRPYGDGGEDAPPFAGADRDEIGAGGGVIVVRQADLFSLGQIHGAGLPVIRRGDPCGRPLFIIAVQTW